MAVTHGADVQARAAARRPIKFINETTWSTSFILFSWLYTSLIFEEEEEKLRPTRVDRLPTLLAG